jgi:hypothetical protein
MLRMPKNPRDRAEKRFAQLARRGRDRADSLRESLPDAHDLVDEIRDQAQPVMERTRKSATDAVNRATGRKPARSKKPFVLLALLLLAGLAAYVILNRRDNEPATLLSEPDQPDVQPAAGPSSEAPSDTPSTAPGSAVPWSTRPNVVGSPVGAGATASSDGPSATTGTPSAPVTPPSSRPTGSSSTLGRTDVRPSPRMAAWDLPSSVVPPSR